MRITFNSLFSTDDVVNSINHYFGQLDTVVELSEDDNCQLTLTPLHLMPTLRNSEKKVFSIIALKERRNFIAIRNDVLNPSDSIGFPYSSKLKVNPDFVDIGLKEIKDKLQTEQLETVAIIEGLRKGSIEIAIIEGCFVNDEIKKRYRLIPLNEREFGHFPGQGFLALEGNADLGFGKLLRKFNKRESIISANIERKMMTMVNFKINNHCEMDQDGNFHLWVFSEKGSAQVSQSTRNEIEERAISQLEH